MNYYLDLFSPETAKAFANSTRDISGFRASRKAYVQNRNVGPGDKFICYCTRIQRFIGVMEIQSKPFVDDKPIFTNENDPFVLRFKVKTLVWLPFEKAIPIHDDLLWKNLSFTKKLEKFSTNWTFMVFSSPKAWPEKDCRFLEEKLLEQGKKLIDYPLSETDEKKLRTSKIKIGSSREVTVTIPDDEEEQSDEEAPSEAETRKSIVAQAKLAEIGEKLGYKIWLPMSDRARITEIWKPEEGSLLEDLPLVFDEITLKTIRNIDVLWIDKRAIIRAFEVEDTTSIYSGILRMADLLALQPMLDIKIHIVAPANRKDSVMRQIARPVFAVMDKGPLSELCSFISYDALDELAKEKRLEHMTDTIIDEYSEFSED